MVVGDLYILNIPASFTKAVLTQYLNALTTIRGTLHVRDNTYLSAMTFLSNVVSLSGAVYSNNPQMVDARLFSLHRLTGNVTVDGCDRLCPERYTTTVGAAVDERGCANLTMQYFVHVEGAATKNNVGIVGLIMRSVVQAVSGGMVGVWLLH